MNGALEGVRVVDTTQYVAGPYCTMLMADLGADVIKVERPGGGDVYRRQGPQFLNGESISFLSLNRNKASVTLDLKSAEDRDVLKRLIAEADVFVENSVPGTMARAGLGYRDLEAVNRGLIYCSISGYGQTGPRAGEGGYDLMLQGEGGIMSVTGEPGGPPAKVGVAAFDFGTAMYGVIGILSAYIHRQRTGVGQHVDTSLLDTSASWFTMLAASYWATGEVPGPIGSRSPFFAPYQAFRARDRSLTVIGTGGEDGWGRFCRVLELPALIEDRRFATNTDRIANLDALETIIGERLAERDADDWIARLKAAGLPAGPINTLDRALADPQVLARELVIEIDHPRAGRYRAVGFPIKLSATPPAIRRAPPALGEDNDAILGPLRGREAPTGHGRAEIPPGPVASAPHERPEAQREGRRDGPWREGGSTAREHRLDASRGAPQRKRAIRPEPPRGQSSREGPPS